MNRKVYEDALYAVNFAREAKGLEPIERIPPGCIGSQYLCPMAVGLRPALGTVGVGRILLDLIDRPGECDLAEAIRPEVTRFARDFDDHAFAAGVSRGLPIDPATLVPEYREQVPEVKEERVPEGAK